MEKDYQQFPHGKLDENNAKLKEVKVCVLGDNKHLLKGTSPYIPSSLLELSLKSYCLCIDDWISIPKASKEAVLQNVHSTHRTVLSC